MMSSSATRSSSPYRRRRILWIVLLISAAIIFYASTHDTSSWSLPSYLKDAGFSSSPSSKAGKEKMSSSAGRLRVQEIHGLLHFVTAYPNRRLNEEEGSIDAVGLGLTKVDPSTEVDLRVFSPDGDDDWQQYVKDLRKNYPLIVFSKTYCGFSKRAKALLESYHTEPHPFVVELDTRPDGQIIQGILGRLTGRSTVPNILLQGDSIGGSDDLYTMDQEGKLKTLLEEGGVKVLGKDAS